MKLQHEFDVPASPERAMALLLDPETVVPCMPGAELDEVVDEHHWKATAGLKLGPVGLTFATTINVDAVDEEAGTATLGFDATDTRGKGGAKGAVAATVVAADEGSRVTMDTDVAFSGMAARLGRPNIVKAVSGKLIDSFADCLRKKMDTG